MVTLDVSRTRNCLSGKRVICVGNGPSLNQTNFDLVKQFPSIGLNRISQIYSKKNWTPDFLVCTTINVQQADWKADIQRSIQLGIPTLLGTDLQNFITGDDNAKIYPVETFGGESLGEEGADALWSDDLEKNVCKMGSSILVSAQWAAYMGASEIIFIGCDLGFDRSILQRVAYKFGFKRLGNLLDRSHFSRSYGTPGGSGEFFNANMTRAHLTIKTNCARLGIKCWNATVGGDLNVYPRKDLESFLLGEI